MACEIGNLKDNYIFKSIFQKFPIVYYSYRQTYLSRLLEMNEQRVVERLRALATTNLLYLTLSYVLSSKLTVM
jgi:hypothetical protein